MKHQHRLLLLAGLTGLWGCSGNQDHEVDLSSAFEAAATDPSWDGTRGFPDVEVQKPIGACQSFAMTAMVEYLYYNRTGHVVDLSEKFTAYKVLETMIQDFWDPSALKYTERPDLGLGIGSYMIDVVTSAGAVPEASYPWGNLVEDQDKQINVELFKQVFENEVAVDRSPVEYTALLDEALLSQPPAHLNHTVTIQDYSTGQTRQDSLHSPTELGAYIGLTKDRFAVVLNSDMHFTRGAMTPEQVEEILKYFEDDADKRNVAHRRETTDGLTQAIIESLDRRMVVGIAADVWLGDWTTPTVNWRGGGHALVVVGYQQQDGKTYFKLRNSWGKSIGTDGYNFIEASLLVPNTYYLQVYR